MQSPHFLAKLNRNCQFTLRIVGAPIRRLLVSRIAEPRLSQRLKCSEPSVGPQFFWRLRKRSFSSAPVKPARS